MKSNWFIFLVILSALSACKNGKDEAVTPKFPFHLVCDFEIVEGDKFIGEGGNLGHAKNRSTNEARSGRNSVMVDEQHQFAAEYKFGPLKKGVHIEASVWRKSKDNKGVLVIQDIDGNIYWANSTPIKKDGEWEMLYIEKVLPSDVTELKVFLFNPNSEPAYFDDMEILVNQTKSLPEFDNVMDLKVSIKNFDKIQKYRDEALAQKQITKNLKKYVKAELTYEGITIPVEIRIKGDWTDHLNTNKWSFRIKTKKGYAFKGMTSFSIQSPHTRDFMNEWFMHQLFQKEGILTTQYFFLPVRINGEMIGMFACEEHFEKQLPESQKRREGPILKLDEEGFWQSKVAAKSTPSLKLPYYEESQIVAFNEKRVLKNPALKQRFETGADLLRSLKDFKGDLGEIFDLDYAARYYALFDVANSFHGLAWHNQRFYYNPVSAKLEQIGYDLFEETGHHKSRRPILGLFSEMAEFNIDWYLNYQLMANKEFMHAYFNYLHEFSNPEYLSNAFNELEPELSEIEGQLKLEYRLYDFDKAFFVNNALEIKRTLEFANQEKAVKDSKVIITEYAEEFNESELVKDISIKAFIQDTIGDYIKIRIQNFHTSPVEIFAYSLAKHKDSLIDLKPIQLKKFDGDYDQIEVILPLKTRRFHFKATNTADQIHVIKVFKWREPEPITIHEKLKKEALSPQDIGMIIKNGNVQFKSKDVELRKNLIIPANHHLFLEAGTQINLMNGACIISYSNILSQGEKNNLVRIYSSDSSGQGILVLSAKDTNHLTFTSFENLSNFQFEGWSQTGAVTFYNTTLIAGNCEFKSNSCEDALNVVSCKFRLTECLFDNTYADAFDADFCEGDLTACTFRNVANDAVDVSGSIVTTKGCVVESAGDKGFSGGERSDLTVDDAMISNCNIGIASKDDSKVIVHNSNIKNCHLAYAIYQKKPEFGQATMTVIGETLNQVKQKSLIGLGSRFTIDNMEIMGKIKVNVDSLYANPTGLK